MPRRKIRPNLDVDITWDDVQDKPSTFPPSSHNHDERYYTKTELQTSGQSQVHWNNVSNKPSLITGSGTTNTIPKFTGANTIGNSVISETSDGAQIQTGKTLVLNEYGLDWNGYFTKFPTQTIRDHFTTSNLSTYWGGWTTTPQGSDHDNNFRNHILRAVPSGAQNNITCFLYRSHTGIAVGSGTGAWVGADSNSVDVGLRWDNGYVDDANEYAVEFFIRAGVGTYNLFDAALFRRLKSGSTITEVQLSSTFPGGKAFGLRMTRSSSTVFLLYADDDVRSSYTAGITVSSNITWVRHGLFVRNTTSAGPRSGYFHFYTASFF